jgi:outer membrane protein TolC
MTFNEMKMKTKEKSVLYGVCPGSTLKKDLIIGKLSLLFLIIAPILMNPWPALAQQRFNSILNAGYRLAELRSADGGVSSKSASETTSETSQTPEPVRLTLLDALRNSLLGNQDIEIATYTPKQAALDLTEAESVYDLSLFSSNTHTHGRTLEMTSSLDFTDVDDATTVQAGIRKLLSTGGTFSVFMKFDRFDRDTEVIDMDARYSSAPTVELEQPLLKGFGARAERAAIEIANRSMNISDAEFRQSVLDVVTEVSRVYWLLYMYREMEQIDKQTLDMAKEVHRREVARLQEGISKQLDVERARSAVEARSTDLVRSKRRVRLAMDELRLLMNWSTLTIDSNQEIIPLEKPKDLLIDVIEKEAIKKAFENRPELEKAREAVGISVIREDLARHERLPKLDAFGRYGVDGQGDSLSNSFDEIRFDDDNIWAVGLEFEMPIGNRAAKARYRKQTLAHRQTEVRVEQLENQIKREIRQAIHAIVLAKDELKFTRLEKEAAENVVEGEFARFELGQMTNEELLRAQEHLASARRNNTQALVNYNIALANLARAEGILTPGLSFADIN